MENEKSPYYLGNKDYLPVLFEIEYKGKTITSEMHWDAGSDELMNAFYSSLCMYFNNYTVLLSFRDYAHKVDVKESDPRFLLDSDFRLIVKDSDKVVTITIDHNWYTSIFDIIQAFHTAMLALTWTDNQIYDMLDRFSEEYLSDIEAQTNNEER